MLTVLSEHRNSSNPPNSAREISLIIPLFNEQEVIQRCHNRVCETLVNMGIAAEIIYIDDGSDDSSWQRICELTPPNENIEVVCVRLSRNFGKEPAMSAGLQKSRGQAVILLDADLQDPPELIPQMVSEWKKGYDVVDMKRSSRAGEGWVKRATASLFYQVMKQLSDTPIPQNVGDFRLLDSKVVKHINALPERTRFMKGLFAWPGFKRTTLEFDRLERVAGSTKWNYFSLIHLAVDGITSFSTKPLRLATVTGGMLSFVALTFMVILMAKTLMFGDPVAGYPSLMCALLMLGGVQLLSIGLLGEYVGRIFIETKNRPLYLVMDEKKKKIESENRVREQLHEA
jgi:glycosyltransferase involved in cell wall biosynthesis